MALTAALPAVALRGTGSTARARTAAPARCAALPQRAVAPAVRSAFLAAPLAPALAPRNCRRSASRSVAVASLDVPSLESVKPITLTCVFAAANARLLRRARVHVFASPIPPLTPPLPRSSGVGPLLPASSGIYAMYDAAGALQYVGMSRKARQTQR